MIFFFFFKQKTAYEMRISDWSSDVCSSDLRDIVLITGSTGFIGRAVITELAEDYTIVGLDRRGPPASPAPAHTVDFELGSDEGVARALDEVGARFGSRYASVGYLAVYYDISGVHNPLYDKVTVNEAGRMIECM